MTQVWLMVLLLALLAAVAVVQIAYLRVLRSIGDDTRVRAAVGIRVVNTVLVLAAAGLITWAILR